MLNNYECVIDELFEHLLTKDIIWVKVSSVVIMMLLLLCPCTCETQKSSTIIIEWLAWHCKNQEEIVSSRGAAK